MHETTFPKPVREVITTLIEIFRHQGQGEIVELLESVHATIHPGFLMTNVSIFRTQTVRESNLSIVASLLRQLVKEHVKDCENDKKECIHLSIICTFRLYSVLKTYRTDQTFTSKVIFPLKK